MHAYLEMAPDLQPYFVAGWHDDVRGIGVTMGVRADYSAIGHLLSAAPVVVIVINSVIAGAIAGLLVGLAGQGGPIALTAGMLVFVVVLLIHTTHGRRRVARGRPPSSAASQARRPTRPGELASGRRRVSCAEFAVRAGNGL